MTRLSRWSRRAHRFMTPDNAAAGIPRGMLFVLLASLANKPGEYLNFFALIDLYDRVFHSSSIQIYTVVKYALLTTEWLAFGIGLTLLAVATARLISPGCKDAIWGTRPPGTRGPHCDACGYALAGLPQADARCPECGEQLAPAKVVS